MVSQQMEVRLVGGWSHNKWRCDWWEDGLTTTGGETGGRMVSQQMEVRLVGEWSHNKWR